MASAEAVVKCFIFGKKDRKKERKTERRKEIPMFTLKDKERDQSTTVVQDPTQEVKNKLVRATSLPMKLMDVVSFSYTREGWKAFVLVNMPGETYYYELDRSESAGLTTIYRLKPADPMF